MKVTIRPISASAAVDPAEGGSVVDPASGTSVTLPPNTLVYPDGSPVTGPVTLSLSVIDVTDPAGLASMPGDFSAVAADGKEVMLQSLGAAWIGATDEAGQTLEVKEGSEGVVLDLRTEARANAEKIGAVPEMWSFNDDTGKWELEPTEMKLNGEPAPNLARPAVSSAASSAPSMGVKPGKKKGKKFSRRKEDYSAGEGIVTGCMSPEDFMKRVAEDGPKSLSAAVTKIGYINCDLAYHHPQRAVMLKGLVLDSQKQPMPNVQLWGSGRDYEGRTPDATGADGRFGAMIAQFDSEVDVEVHFGKPVDSNNKVEVAFDEPRFVRKLSPDLYKLASNIPGPYVEHKEVSFDGQLGWVKKSYGDKNPTAIISWNHQRRRWENRVGDKVVFFRPAGDEPGLPFGDGWLCAAGLEECKHVPKYTRAIQIMTQSFGPFKTGPPGEFVDVGDLVVYS